MSDGKIERRYDVHCRACGTYCADLVAKTMREAEKELRSNGWGTRSEEWHCEECLEDMSG